MSQYNRVADYLSGLPDAVNHMDRYVTEFLERHSTSRNVIIDGVEAEKQILSPAERNVIRALNCQLKFTKAHFGDGFNLSVRAVARHKNSYKDRTDKLSTIQLSFRGSREWQLLPSRATVMYATAESSMHLMDDQIKRHILARCHTMLSSETSSLPMAAVSEKMQIPMDMRHMFMKMYLYLMDYSLAVTSKSTTREVCDDIEYQGYPNVSQAARISAMMDRSIVIDTDGMTPEELGLLVLSSNEYPSVFYGSENIYTNCSMEKDDMVLVSDGDIVVDKSYLWGSPDRLYNLIWSVATKLDCVASLVQAFRMMRGMPKMASDMFSRVKESNTILSMVPPSHSLTRALGEIPIRPSLSRAPGWFSTSFSLATDLIYGSMFEAVATNVVEELGGIGKALSSATPATSRVFNGLLRDYGLEHADPTVNVLLQGWNSISGTVIKWGFGKMLKDYCVGLAGEIQNGLDIRMPQIMALIPYCSTPNTVWGYSRGWTGTSDLLELSKKARREQTNKLAAVAWVLGIREVRPRVFRNTFSTEELTLSPLEYELASEASNGCELEDVQLWLADSVGGRVDEQEKTASGLTRTEYAGAKCSLIYDTIEKQWVIDDKKPDYRKMVSESLKGEPKAEKLEEMDGLKPVTFGGIPTPQDPFEHLKSMNKTSLIRPSAGPRHFRMGSDMTPFVPEYVVDGERESGLLTRTRLNVKEGDEIEIKEISVMHDGSCGIHSIVEDLRVRGMLDTSDARKASEMFAEGTASKNFHDTEELAALAEQWGFGLSVINEDGNVYKFGDGKQEHDIVIARRGLSFQPAIIGKGGRKLKSNKIHEQTAPNDEFIAKVKEMRHIFGAVRR
ncbi:P4 [Macrophomina phaseolina chrysovirus 1]|uniref:p4 n=1 Tax=Macrophomina phaseolina chrysovirus 1 TaxID=1708483 RepID=A0A0M4KP22_9VIRU|nr:P4 [Macrophomina phaseolina chrysovirus 1]ALD89093.2 P4 [Macrophomina phaseolina chrysovirus 1]